MINYISTNEALTHFWNRSTNSLGVDKLKSIQSKVAWNKMWIFFPLQWPTVYAFTILITELLNLKINHCEFVYFTTNYLNQKY